MMPSLQLYHAHECTVCKQNVDTDERDENARLVALFGVSTDPYRVCPSCLSEVGHDDYIDEGFRQRIRAFYFTRGIVLRQVASGRWEKRGL